jgi:hypothetical protein
VSPLFRDELGIFLAPGVIVLVRTGQGLRSQLREHKVIKVDATPNGDWLPIVTALADELAIDDWHETNLRIVCADHWVRYEMLPWSTDLSTEAERVEHARFLMLSTYGDIVDNWTLSLSESAPGVARVITALPTQLLEALLDLQLLGSMKILSIQPQLVVSFNTWRHCLPSSSVWFATVVDGSLAAIHLDKGKCDRIRSVRLSDDWTVELERIQTMGRLSRSRSSDGPVYVEAPDHLRTLAERDGSAINWLEATRAPKHTLEHLSDQVAQAS